MDFDLNCASLVRAVSDDSAHVVIFRIVRLRCWQAGPEFGREMLCKGSAFLLEVSIELVVRFHLFSHSLNSFK